MMLDTIAMTLNDPTAMLDWREILLLLFALLEAVFRLTPSEVDNSIWNKISGLLRIILDFLIPNRKKGGGRHKNKA